MKFKKLNSVNFDIYGSDMVSVKEMGNTIEVQYLTSKTEAAPIKKISSEEYINMRTGEVCIFEKKEKENNSRLDSEKSLRKSLKTIRELVATNVTDAKKVRWVTLTYRENMTDTRKLYEDFRKFNQRFKYYCATYEMDYYEYICVAEPQRRGAWHLHVFYIWDRDAPFIHNRTLARIWSHGFVKIKALYNIENIAGYFQAYLTNIEIPEENTAFYDMNELKEIKIDGVKKNVVKGGRLKLYPSGFNIVRCSRNIKRPVKKQMTYDDAMKLVQNKKLCYETVFKLEDEKTGYHTIVYKQEFR